MKHAIPILAVFLLVGLAGPALADFVAFNDMYDTGVGNHANATSINYRSNGELKDIVTGLGSGVIATGTQNGPVDEHSGNGGPVNAGTDAAVFNGMVSFKGSMELDTTDRWYQMTFTNLNPGKLYTITSSYNRDSTSYTGQRWGRVSLIGADSSTNTSSAGVKVYPDDSVSFACGYNKVNGYVAEWSNVRSGADASFAIKTVWDNSEAGSKGYGMGVFRLEEVPEPSTIVLAVLGLAGLFVIARRRRS